ncbi:MAG: hypothetical protein RIN55_07805 [Tissierellaceae bacterium]|nr:hypothetical protein [Tissierellaceae bacterium]
MNCDKCGFYCYDDEYICPNCECLLKKELPMDGYEKSLFINDKIIEFKKGKKRLDILKLRKTVFLLVIIMQIVLGFWLSSFVVYRFPARTNYVIARYSIVFALTLYIIILGKPELPSNKSYVEVRKPRGLINKKNINKNIYLSIIFLIFILNCLFYFLYLKNLFITDILIRGSSKVESFGINKLENVIGIRFFSHNLGIGIFYAIHSIFNITDADYYILTRRDLHKKIK